MLIYGMFGSFQSGRAQHWIGQNPGALSSLLGWTQVSNHILAEGKTGMLEGDPEPC